MRTSPFAALSGAQLVSIDGGTSPEWAGDRETVYRRERQVLSVTVTPGETLTLGRPSVLFEIDDEPENYALGGGIGGEGTVAWPSPSNRPYGARPHLPNRSSRLPSIPLETLLDALLKDELLEKTTHCQWTLRSRPELVHPIRLVPFGRMSLLESSREPSTLRVSLKRRREALMSNVHRFQCSVHWTGTREGRLEAPGLPPLAIGAPPEFGGPKERWTPEHFFVSSANACIMMTFLAIADISRLPVRAWTSEARGTLEKVEGQGYRFTRIDVEAHIEVDQENDIERARRIVEKAEAACLVSHSMLTPVHVIADVTSAERPLVR